MRLRKLIKFVIKNYFLTIFAGIIIFVALIAVYKLAFSRSYYVYAKVKLGQGLWWVASAKPNIWIVNAIKKGDFEKDLTGKNIAEVIEVKTYSWWSSDQFDTYLTLKLNVGANRTTNKYTFKRSSIGVGSPIDLEFSSVQVSGTIVQLSGEPIVDKYIDKTIILTKKNAYPWEYEAIRIGDKYSDGVNNIFEILDKKSLDTSIISSDLYGNSNPAITEVRKYITVKAKVKVKELSGQLILGEDQVIHQGKTINISTPNFTFTDYFVGEIK